MVAQLLTITARDLRQSVKFQRRTLTTSALGATKGAWSDYIAQRAASLTPLRPRRGNAEEVIAARLQGTSIWDLWVRWDSLTSTITNEDRVIDLRNVANIFNIRWVADLEGRKRWLFMQLEQGSASG